MLSLLSSSPDDNSIFTDSGVTTTRKQLFSSSICYLPKFPNDDNDMPNTPVTSPGRDRYPFRSPSSSKTPPIALSTGSSRRSNTKKKKSSTTTTSSKKKTTKKRKATTVTSPAKQGNKKQSSSNKKSRTDSSKKKERTTTIDVDDDDDEYRASDDDSTEEDVSVSSSSSKKNNDNEESPVVSIEVEDDEVFLQNLASENGITLDDTPETEQKMLQLVNAKERSYIKTKLNVGERVTNPAWTSGLCKLVSVTKQGRAIASTKIGAKRFPGLAKIMNNTHKSPVLCVACFENMTTPLNKGIILTFQYSPGNLKTHLTSVNIHKREEVKAYYDKVAEKEALQNAPVSSVAKKQSVNTEFFNKKRSEAPSDDNGA
jgi:hypothetical protein